MVGEFDFEGFLWSDVIFPPLISAICCLLLGYGFYAKWKKIKLSRKYFRFVFIGIAVLCWIGSSTFLYLLLMDLWRIGLQHVD